MPVYRCRESFVAHIAGTKLAAHIGDLVEPDEELYRARPGAFDTVEQYMAVRRQRRGLPPAEKPKRGLLGRKSKEPELKRPPASGPGSGVDAWRQYATEVTGEPAEAFADLSRDEIIERLDSEGAGNGQE